MRRFLKDNGLSIVLAILFATFFASQAVSGWPHYNQEQNKHAQREIRLPEYLQTGAFGEAVFGENWESEFLQMALYVLLTVFLVQRGSAESKNPHKEESQRETELTPSRLRSSRKERGIVFRIYKHSLSLAFALLFIASFAGHAI
jgi:hypothetical protein